MFQHTVMKTRLYFCFQCLKYRTEQQQDLKKLEKLNSVLMRHTVAKWGLNFSTCLHIQDFEHSVWWMQDLALLATQKFILQTRKFMGQSTKQSFLSEESFPVYIRKRSIFLELCNLLYFVCGKQINCSQDAHWLSL